MADRYRDARDNVVEDAQRNIWMIDVEQQIGQDSQTRKGFESICMRRSETTCLFQDKIRTIHRTEQH